MQGLSMLLAMILKALGPHSERYYESDDEYNLPDRVPLLKNYVPPQSYAVTEPAYGVKNDSWNLRTNSKVCEQWTYALKVSSHMHDQNINLYVNGITPSYCLASLFIDLIMLFHSMSNFAYR